MAMVLDYAYRPFNRPKIEDISKVLLATSSLPCSPDLAPSDFHLFSLLKNPPGGNMIIADNEEVQHECLMWLRQ